MTDNEDGTVTIQLEGGQTQTVALPAEGEVLAIRDASGDIWTVDSMGNVSQAPPGSIISGSGPAAAAPADQKIDFVIQFAADQNQRFGFDNTGKNYQPIAQNYTKTTLSGKEYWVAAKSIASGSTDLVEGKMTGGQPFPEYVGFKTSLGNLDPQAGSDGHSRRLTLPGGLNKDSYQVTAFAVKQTGDSTKEEVAVGKLNVYSYDLIRNKVILVPVNGVSKPDAGQIHKRLNEIYGQAVAQWEVTVDKEFKVEASLLEGFDEGESGLLASFPDKMREFNRKFKQSRTIDNQAYYLFLIEGTNFKNSGFMPFKRQMGYIYVDNGNDIPRTIAHELGHGAFRLRHTFSSEGFIAYEKSTDNLMDYYGGSHLLKHQWDNVHDPVSLSSWLQDDSESAEGFYEYDYIVSDNDARIRESVFPHGITQPTQIILQTLQVALIDTVRVNANLLAAKVKAKGTGTTFYTSYSNLKKIIAMKDKTYKFKNNYTALGVPYGIEATDENSKYIRGNTVVINKVCGDYVKIKGVGVQDVEGHWVLSSVLMTPLSEAELALVDSYKALMSSKVANDYEGFVQDFRKDGYFTTGNEPLTWMEAHGIQENEITFLGMNVSKIITPFKEVLEETEKNLKNDYPDAYNLILTQFSGAVALKGQEQIRYIANNCGCNPSNHSLGAAIDIRPALNPQITRGDIAYVTFIKYITGVDLTKSKIDQQVVTAQETFMMKIHGQKTSLYTLKQIMNDYKLTMALTSEFDLLADLGNLDIDIEDFQTIKGDLIDVLNAHKNRVIFASDAKTAIDEMATYLNSITMKTIIPKKDIPNWDKVVMEKKAFLDMVKNAGFSGLSEFLEYFGKKDGLLYKNKLFEDGFGELPIELVKSFHKAHQTISLKYDNKAEGGEWGGSYSDKYDGMHFGLKTSFIKALTNK